MPPLEEALRGAGFAPKTDQSVGVWVTSRSVRSGVIAEVAVDLLVPEAVSPGTGRRAARLTGHDPRAARIVRGLEGVLVDQDLVLISSFDPADTRGHRLQVAGPAALLVSKLHKIAERQESTRQNDKDALDVLRLLRGVTSSDLAGRIGRLLSEERSTEVCREALTLLTTLFGSRNAPGSKMVVRATAGLADAEEMALSCELLAGDLLSALDSGGR